MSKLDKLGCWTVALFLLPFSSVSPQSVSSANACIAKLPPSEFARVPVLVDVNAEDPTAEKILPAADLLAQIVSERMRKTLGGSESGPLPVADSVVKWS